MNKERIAQWWADRLEVKDKQEAFEVALLARIDDHVRMLKVDYDPDDILLEALHEAGVECRGVLFSAKGVLPMKTTMKIKGSTIRVKQGYGNNWETLDRDIPFCQWTKTKCRRYAPKNLEGKNYCNRHYRILTTSERSVS